MVLGVVKIIGLENLSNGEHKEVAAAFEVGGCYKQKQKTWLHTLKQ